MKNVLRSHVWIQCTYFINMSLFVSILLENIVKWNFHKFSSFTSGFAWIVEALIKFIDWWGYFSERTFDSTRFWVRSSRRLKMAERVWRVVSRTVSGTCSTLWNKSSKHSEWFETQNCPTFPLVDFTYLVSPVDITRLKLNKVNWFLFWSWTQTFHSKASKILNVYWNSQLNSRNVANTFKVYIV